jgi:Amt family ammonium transporter
MSGQTTTFMMHLLALVIVGSFTFIGSFALYKLTDLILPLRVSAEQEAIGLDMSQHGESITEDELLMERA